MYQPSLDFLRQVLNPGISDFRLQLIQKNFNPSGVYRIALVYSESHPGLSTVILKFFEPASSNPFSAVDRECSYYQIIFPKVEIIKPDLYYVGSGEDGRTSVLIIEDLNPRYFIPTHPHYWTPQEFSAVLRTYAKLHALGGEWLPPENQRDWMLQPQERRWNIDDIPEMVDVIKKAGIWGQDLNVINLVEETKVNLLRYADYPSTLLHYDAVPPNIGLPSDAEKDAILIDWHDATWGFAQLDLAYFFNQPFSSAKNINREEALDYYWRIRGEIQGKLDSQSVRKTIQRHADIIMSFTLIAVGHRVALSPYPEGTYPRLHWDSMFGILYERLVELSQGV